MSVLKYDLTQEQEKRLREGTKIFGFEYASFGFSHNILVPNPNQKGNIRVGYVEERKYGKGGYWLEIYNYDGLPNEVKKRLDLVLNKCGLGKVKPGS